MARDLVDEVDAVAQAWLAWLETEGPPPPGADWERLADALTDLMAARVAIDGPPP